MELGFTSHILRKALTLKKTALYGERIKWHIKTAWPPTVSFPHTPKHCSLVSQLPQSNTWTLSQKNIQGTAGCKISTNSINSTTWNMYIKVRALEAFNWNSRLYFYFPQTSLREKERYGKKIKKTGRDLKRPLSGRGRKKNLAPTENHLSTMRHFSVAMP